ncbi:MAG: C_GCAxxG_C_C family protein [Deltaproteobacteria bacterium]|nr:C_GCAxxG_C_C family protein [Deltaproteobacteria bacterium]
MEVQEKIAMVKDRARKNFSKGFNCAECVLEAVLEHVDTGLPKEALKLVTGFGGGVGLYGDTCGAIIGAVMAVGAVHGRTDLPEGEDGKAVAKAASRQLYGNPGLYRLFNQLPNMIKNKYGNTLCRELCSQWQDKWFCRDQALHCREIITDIAEFAATLIYSDKNEIMSKSFGDNVENLKDAPATCDAKG